MIYEPDVAQNPDTGGGVQSAKEGSQQPPLVTCGDSCAQKLSTKMHRNTNSGQFGKMHRNTNIERFYNNRQYKANIGKINVMHHFAFW